MLVCKECGCRVFPPPVIIGSLKCPNCETSLTNDGGRYGIVCETCVYGPFLSKMLAERYCADRGINGKIVTLIHP